LFDALPETMPEILLEQIPVEFEISGISYETVIELVSHDEASIPWLPNPTMAYMRDPAFRVQGTEQEQRWQREGVRRFLALCDEHPAPAGSKEIAAGLALGTRAVEMSYVMSLADLNKLFIGRLSHHGNEQEIQEVCRAMAEALHRRFPEIIQAPARYYELNNEAKY
jgi:hypothetical protein